MNYSSSYSPQYIPPSQPQFIPPPQPQPQPQSNNNLLLFVGGCMFLILVVVIILNSNTSTTSSVIPSDSSSVIPSDSSSVIPSDSSSVTQRVTQSDQSNDPSSNVLIDCVGNWENTGTCVIDRCDPSNIGRGLGKQTQEFLVQKYSENEGKPCPGPTRQLDCSIDNYIDCVQCGGLAGNYTEGASCTNIKSCEGTMGIGQREDTWSANSLLVLPNCTMPANKYVPCTENNFSACTCNYVYDYPKYSDCNENNIFCEGGTGVCTANYTKTDELPGGICPEPNNIYRNPDDQQCTCNVNRSYGPWTFTTERCDSTRGVNNQIPIGTRTRTITITKIGGYKSCKIIPEPNERLLENTTGVLNAGGYFQFKPEVDVSGGTFQTVQIENNFINTDINDKSCVCDVHSGTWTEWQDITLCPNRNDYTKSDNAFKKKQRRDIYSNKQMYPNMICPSQERELACPRDCSGNWEYGICKNNLDVPINCNRNITGKVQGTRTNIFKEFRSRLDGKNGIYGDKLETITGGLCPANTTEPCEMRCDVDCSGTWIDTGTCVIDRCDPSNIGRGLGKQTQRFNVIQSSANQGETCPGPTREIECSIDNYIDCIQCGGLAGNYTRDACKNINRCTGTMGIGERENKWASNSLLVLPNCTMPANQYVSCIENNYPACTCSYVYDYPKYTDCNENNIFCEGGTGVCTSNFTKTDELPGGICPEPNNIYRNPDDQQCTCNVNRSYGPWTFTIERCGLVNNQTPIGTRTRTITITKIGGNKRCKVIPEPNERLLENTTGVLNAGGYFQFKPEVDVSGGTFQTVQIENNFNDTSDNKSCVCEETEWSNWTDITSCPDRKDYTKSDDAFKKTQRRVKSSNKQMYPNMTCPPTSQERQLMCPRDCSGSFVYGECKNFLGNSCIPRPGWNPQHIQGLMTKTFNVFKSQIDGEFEDISGNIIKIASQSCQYNPSDTMEYCDISCCKSVGIWQIGDCIIDRCDSYNPGRGLGKETWQFTLDRLLPSNTSCPKTEEVGCSIANYIGCRCEGTWTEWKDISSCPHRKDYTKSDDAFKKKQRRDISFNKQMYPYMICPTEERELRCPRDCSGNWEYGICMNSLDLPITCNGMTGKVQGTRTNTLKVLKSNLDGEDENRNIIVGLYCPAKYSEPCEISC